MKMKTVLSKKDHAVSLPEPRAIKMAITIFRIKPKYQPCSNSHICKSPYLPRIAIFILLWAGVQTQLMAEVPLARQVALRHMLKQDCGSCHGMTLKGGLGPALTVDQIADKPKQLLLTTILNGRPGTPMPPFRGMLTEEEVHWLVDLLYKGDV